MIILAVRYICATCNITLELPQRVPSAPIHVDLDISPPPPTWTMGEDGLVYCPSHPQRLVEPVAAMPHLKVVQ